MNATETAENELNRMAEEGIEPPPAAEAAKAPSKPKQEIAVDDGALVAANANQLALILEKVSKGGGFPERFDSAEKRIAAYNLTHSLMGPRWQLALNNVAIIHGQMCIYGELPGALAEQTKEVQEKDVYCIDKNSKRICVSNGNLDESPYAGVVDIQRQGRAKKQYTFTINEAIAANLYPATKWDKTTKQRVPNPDSPWMKYTKIMLMRKAMAQAIKFEFPDAMVGVPVAEYDFDEMPEIKDVTNSVSEARHERATDLNKRFSTPSQAQAQ